MKKIVDIAENKFTSNEILNMKSKGKITKGECLLLFAAEDDAYLFKYVNGVGEFRLYYDSNVDTNLYYTNVHELLKSFYSSYEKFPNYHFDKMLDDYLLSKSKLRGCVYKILTIINLHIQNEKNNISTFKLNNVVEILDNCKSVIMENINYFKETKQFEASNEKDGYFSVIQKYNEKFKELLNYDLLSSEEPNNKIF